MKKRLLYLAAPVLMLAGAPSASAALRLQYTYDESSGDVEDTVDTATFPAADGTLQGGAQRTANTPSGTGAALDLFTAEGAAPGAYTVTSGDVPKLDGLSRFTLTTWLNLDEGGTFSDRLLSKQAATSFDGFNWSIHDPNAGSRAAGDVKMGLFVGGDTAFTFAYSTADVNALDKWVFLAVSYDGTQTTNNTTYYVGGVDTPVTQLGDPVTINAGPTTDSAARFAVGFTDAATTSDTSPNGFLDDSRVYDEVLGLATLEAARLANVPEPTSLAAMALAGAGLLARRRRGA